jgi:hypothetical protein
VAPLAVRDTVPPVQIVELLGVTVRLIGGFKFTVIAAVADPQVPRAKTETVPAADPKFTVMAFVPAPDATVAPAGTDQV